MIFENKFSFNQNSNKFHVNIILALLINLENVLKNNSHSPDQDPKNCWAVQLCLGGCFGKGKPSNCVQRKK